MAKRSIKDINAQLTALLNGDLGGGGDSGGGITVKTVVNSDHAGTVDPQEKVTLSFSPALGDNERIVGVAAIQVLEDSGKPATFVITDVTINANSTQADITIMNALLVTQVLHSVTVGLIVSSGSGGGGGGDITKTSQLENDGDGASPFATQNWVVSQAGGIKNVLVNGAQATIDEGVLKLSCPQLAADESEVIIANSPNGTSVNIGTSGQPGENDYFNVRVTDPDYGAIIDFQAPSTNVVKSLVNNGYGETTTSSPWKYRTKRDGSQVLFEAWAADSAQVDLSTQKGALYGSDIQKLALPPALSGQDVNISVDEIRFNVWVANTNFEAWGSANGVERGTDTKNYFQYSVFSPDMVGPVVVHLSAYIRGYYFVD